jgi:hypothetical protein
MTLSPGNNLGNGTCGKTVCSVVIVVAMALGTAVCSYRLKKTAEIRLWEKSLSDYSERLQNENLAAIKEAQSNKGSGE